MRNEKSLYSLHECRQFDQLLYLWRFCLFYKENFATIMDESSSFPWRKSLLPDARDVHVTDTVLCCWQYFVSSVTRCQRLFGLHSYLRWRPQRSWECKKPLPPYRNTRRWQTLHLSRILNSCITLRKSTLLLAVLLNAVLTRQVNTIL